MHVRFTSCIGLDVLVEHTNERAAYVGGILINPDTAAVEGFFVYQHGHPDMQFLATGDIIRFSTAIYIDDPVMITPINELIRLKPVLGSGRPVIGQPIKTDRGRTIGICKDVQFSTRTMKVDWLFPKKWWRWGVALPVSAVTEITQKAIIVQSDQLLGKKRATKISLEPVAPDVAVAPPVVTRQ